LAADSKSHRKVRSKADRVSAGIQHIRRLPAAASRLPAAAASHLPAAATRVPAATAAVAVVGVAGLAATAFALSSQTSTVASGHIQAHSVTTQVAAPHTAATHSVATHSVAARPVTTARAASTVSPRRPGTSHPSSLPAKSHAASSSKTNLDTYHKPATVWFTVQSGDSLSSIAGQVYDNTSAWPVLYYANQSEISSVNDLTVGQELRVPPEPATIPAAPASAVESTSTSTSTSDSTSSDSTSSDSASSDTSTASQSNTTVDASDYSGFQACVIERESGGDAQVMNASGHYGLYQFSESTWVAYGGSPSTFGDATVAEQNAVFATAMADGGEDNWAPYDGC
jgi:nucleoid-associated protein YgaU